MKSRTKGRELALQALYAYEMGNNDFGVTIQERSRELKTPADATEFASDLCDKTIRKIEELDSLISKQATNWKLKRVAAIDKNILRMALAEILYIDDIPAKVSIDEAIELAKKYSTEKSSKFVNGILDPIAKASSGGI